MKHKILVATTNPGKTKELSAMLAELAGQIEWLSLRDFPAVQEVEEDDATFAENAATFGFTSAPCAKPAKLTNITKPKTNLFILLLLTQKLPGEKFFILPVTFFFQIFFGNETQRRGVNTISLTDRLRAVVKYMT